MHTKTLGSRDPQNQSVLFLPPRLNPSPKRPLITVDPRPPQASPRCTSGRLRHHKSLNKTTNPASRKPRRCTCITPQTHTQERAIRRSAGLAARDTYSQPDASRSPLPASRARAESYGSALAAAAPTATSPPFLGLTTVRAHGAHCNTQARGLIELKRCCAAAGV